MSLTRVGVVLENPPFSCSPPTEIGFTQRDERPYGGFIGLGGGGYQPAAPALGQVLYNPTRALANLPVLPSVSNWDGGDSNLLASKFKTWVGPFRCLQHYPYLATDGADIVGYSLWAGAGACYQDEAGNCWKTLRQTDTGSAYGNKTNTLWWAKDYSYGSRYFWVPFFDNSDGGSIFGALGSTTYTDGDGHEQTVTIAYEDAVTEADFLAIFADLDSDDIFDNYMFALPGLSVRKDVDPDTGRITNWSAARYRQRGIYGSGQSIRFRWREVTRVSDTSDFTATDVLSDIITYPLRDEYGFHARGTPRFNLLQWRLAAQGVGTASPVLMLVTNRKLTGDFNLGAEATTLRVRLPARVPGSVYQVKVTRTENNFYSPVVTTDTYAVGGDGYTDAVTYAFADLPAVNNADLYISAIQILKDGDVDEAAAWRLEFKQRVRRALIGFDKVGEDNITHRYQTKTRTWTKEDEADKTTVLSWDLAKGLATDPTGWDVRDTFVSQTAIFDEVVADGEAGTGHKLIGATAGRTVRVEGESVKVACGV